MKKLLVFAVILGMASLANAAIIFEAPAVAAPGEVVTISLVANGGEAVSSASIALLSDGGAGGVFAVGAWNGAQPTAWNDPGYKGSDFGLSDGNLGYASVTYSAGKSVTGTIYSTTYTVGAIPVTFTVADLPADGLTSDVTLFDGSKIALAGSTFTIVPEPITMTLLGLGGLALIRRRHA